MATPIGQLVRGLQACSGIAAVQVPPLHNPTLPTACFGLVLAREWVCRLKLSGRDLGAVLSFSR